ncbi:MAG TPA: PTS sugar transporter subunit IIB [Anaerovoracaceae bacterium]|nr:PTS sugar transporter subunit IIB [Anaerovoracaceae bacterium]
MGNYRILIACGTGIATSTVIANRVKDVCTENGFAVTIQQVKIVEVEKLAPDFDLIVASTKVPSTVKTPSVFAINYLTGVNQQATDKEIIAKLQAVAESRKAV